jgi:hypothetical protein
MEWGRPVSHILLFWQLAQPEDLTLPLPRRDPGPHYIEVPLPCFLDLMLIESGACKLEKGFPLVPR